MTEPLFKLEKEMRRPVIDWLASNGFCTAVEFLLCAGYCDLVAGRYAPRLTRAVPELMETIAVELKLHNVAAVVRQAANNRGQCDWSYCAMPADRCKRMQRRTLDKFRREGVGLLSVGHTVEIILDPERSAGARHRVRESLWRRVRKEHAIMFPRTSNGPIRTKLRRL